MSKAEEQADKLAAFLQQDGGFMRTAACCYSRLPQHRHSRLHPARLVDLAPNPKPGAKTDFFSPCFT